uniref:Uncharacterized protein n=1 Tax=Meloidogyne enterolobii TaxID=390850 RepID=A0A6V7VYH1_MELEN|nr:unnamed protein product [Meloidogyne enterolobii]
MLKQSLLLKRWRNAWKICESLKEPNSWKEFANATMKDCNIELSVSYFSTFGGRRHGLGSRRAFNYWLRPTSP